MILETRARGPPMKQMPALLRLAAVGTPVSAANLRTASFRSPPSGKAQQASAAAGTLAKK